MISQIEKLLEHDTAGDPISGLKWSRKTREKICRQLQRVGISVSPRTVGRLLKNLDFKLRVNRKQIAGTKSPERNTQFLKIAKMRRTFEKEENPMVSVDTKKKRNKLVSSKTQAQDWFKNPLRLMITTFGVIQKERQYHSDYMSRWQTRDMFLSAIPTIPPTLRSQL